MGKDKMKITADTNVLVRAAVQDEPHQARLAAKVLQEADLVAVPIPVLCEFVWVLRRGYKKSVSEVSDAIHKLMKSAHVVMNRPAVEAGLSRSTSVEILLTAQSRMKGTGSEQKSLFPSTRRLYLFCSHKAFVPVCCKNCSD